MFRVAVIGSRSVDARYYERMCMAMPYGVTEIVSGGAKGADELGKEYARSYGLKYTEFAPDYARYQRRAPLVRNVEIAKYADYVIALWDGKSKGTAHAIDACEKADTEVRIIRCDD